jgi:hypothetical protein
MDGLDLGVVIGVISLMILAIFALSIACRHDRRHARRESGDGAVASPAAVFGGGDGGGGCSDGGGGGSC